jgi:hypothetical protein
MAPSRRPAGDELRHLDCIVEGVGPDDAELARERIKDLDAAGKRAGVRHGGGAPGFRPAELHRHDLLAGGARHAAGGRELLRIRHCFHVDDDDLELGLIGEESHVVGHREAGFIAAGDQVLRPDAALLQRRIDEDHHAAALPDQRDRAGSHRQGPVFGEGHQPALGADIAHAVGARYAQAGFRDHRLELAAERGGLMVEGFAEAGREHGGAARACGRAAAQCFRDRGRRHQHHQVIGRFRQRLEIRIAGFLPDLVPPRIDEMDRARKLVAVEIAPHPRRPAARAVAGADQHDIAWRRERRDLSFRGFEIQSVLLQSPCRPHLSHQRRRTQGFEIRGAKNPPAAQSHGVDSKASCQREVPTSPPIEQGSWFAVGRHRFLNGHSSYRGANLLRWPRVPRP